MAWFERGSVRRGAVALAAAVGLLSGCATSAPSTPQVASPRSQAFPAVPSPAPLHWGSCPASASVQGVQCAALAVPLDYTKPSGAKITLELSRKAHTSSRYLGAILVNPGGPGGPGLNWVGLSSRVPDGVGSRFDWIGWDPRGVGASRPSIHCEPAYFGTDRPPYDASNQRRYWLIRAKGYAAACGRDAGEFLKHMTTQDNARDMDVIREALRQPTISYYGFSWGSYLGQVYASLFPTHVRRMVLDGVVDPRRAWYQANFDQDIAFEHSIKIFFGWVASNDAVYHLGTTQAAVYAAYSRELRRLATHPAVGGSVGPDEFGDAMLDAGYYVFNWDRDASNFSKIVHTGDGSGVLASYQQNNAGADNENGYAVYNAVECTDVAWPGEAQTLRDSARIARSAPFETWSNTWFNAPCLTWPAAPHTPLSIHSSAGLPPILLIAETFDAATPFSGALEVRRLFGTSSLIEGVGGTTHAGSLNGVSCSDEAIARYLATGRTPARKPGSRSDLKCPPVPRPPASMQ